MQLYTENNLKDTQSQIEKKNAIALSQALQEELEEVHQAAKESIIKEIKYRAFLKPVNQSTHQTESS